MGKIGDLWVRLGLKKDEFTAGLESAEKQSQTFSQKVVGYFNGLVTKTLALGAAFAAIGKGLATAAKNIANFERANSELAAVLGTTKDGVSDLSASAKELGRTSEFTASEVTQLQIALARLGFDTSQIKAMQKSVMDFALAMGTDLGSAAEFTGASLRAFGMNAQDTEHLLDVMSKSTTLSALNFSKLQTSVANVFPIAKEFGLSIEETAAFLGVLANNGYDASMASTALRSILINLTSDNGKFAKGIGHTAKSFDQIIAAFKELTEKGVELGDVNDLVGQRAVGAMTALVRQGDSVQDLATKLKDANGSLKTMAGEMGDNLIGAVKGLQSAWEGLTLAFEGSKGPMKWVVERLTDILNRLTDIISKTEKISGWEMILGPIAGGAIAQGKKNKQPQAPEPYTGPAQSAVALLRGQNQQQETTTGGTHTPTEEELEKQKRKRAQKWKEILETATTDLKNAEGDAEKIEEIWKRLSGQAISTKELNEAWEKFQQTLKSVSAELAEEARLAKEADDAMKAAGDEQYEKFRQQKGLDLIPTSPFGSKVQGWYDEALVDTMRYEELNEYLNALLDEQADKLTNLNGKWVDFQEQIEAVSEAIAQELVSAIEDGLVGAFDALADVLAGVNDGDMAQIAKALLEPLADMAVKAGTLIMMTGSAIEALQKAFENWFGAGGAIIAGAALVAVGVAAKAGLASIGRGGSASSVSSYSSSGNGYGTGGISTAELVVRVEGEVKGSSIILSGQNTLNEWNK